MRRGSVAFIAIALLAGWAVAALLPRTHPHQLLDASLRYVLVVGWPPVVAFVLVRLVIDREPLQDHALGLRFTLSAIMLPLLLIVSAGFIDFVLHQPSPEPPRATLASFAISVPLLWTQSVVEELGWRGYLLPRLMTTVGAWPGLLLHGVAWGLAHAPMFYLAHLTLWHFAGFVITCVLLGILLGWMRLRSGDIWLGAACNATITIGAGLPLLAMSTRTAIYQPAGWLPLLIAIILLRRR